jgi:hypothetical protein
VLAVTLAGAAAGAAPAATQPAGVSAIVSPARVTIGAATTVSGRLTADGGAGGVALELQSDAYPFGSFATVSRTATAPDGAYSFAELRPDRNTRLRVVVAGAPAASSGMLSVTVDPRATLGARSLGPGRTLLSLRVVHARLGGGAPVSVSWFLAPRGSRVFRLAAVTPSRELSPGLLSATATVDPPSKRFAYRVCLNPAWEHAMGPRATHGRCPRADFLLPSGHAG